MLSTNYLLNTAFVHVSDYFIVILTIQFYCPLIITYIANRKFTTRVELKTTDTIMVEDELAQQSSFVRKMNCAIRNLKSKMKGVNYTNLKVLCRQNVPNGSSFT